jgi:hypothetical protein
MKPQTNRVENQTGNFSVCAPWGAIALTLLGVTGCASFEKGALRKSELYYRATSMEQFPPKPETEKIPFLDRAPKGSRVIGVFHFSTDRGRDFAMRSIEHNARKVGADAVWVRGLGEGQFPQTQQIPAHWESRPFTRLELRRYYMPGGAGKPPRLVSDTVPITGYRPEFVPEQRWTTIIHYTTVDALMLKSH